MFFDRRHIGVSVEIDVTRQCVVHASPLLLEVRGTDRYLSIISLFYFLYSLRGNPLPGSYGHAPTSQFPSVITADRAARFPPGRFSAGDPLSSYCLSFDKCSKLHNIQFSHWSWIRELHIRNKAKGDGNSPSANNVHLGCNFYEETDDKNIEIEPYYHNRTQ